MASKRYHQLDSVKLTETIATLRDRIGNRFPESGLYQVSGELLEIAKTASKDAEWIDRPNFLLRLAIVVLIAVVVAGIVITIITLQMPDSRVNLVTFIQALESGINDVVLIGIAIYFLASLERRIKEIVPFDPSIDFAYLHISSICISSAKILTGCFGKNMDCLLHPQKNTPLFSSPDI